MSVVLLSSPELWKYRRRGKHPAIPDRLQWTFELLSAYRAFDQPNVRLLAPRTASEPELARWHTPEYIEAVRELSDNALADPEARPAITASFGFGNADNPIFPGMYQAAALRAGGALQAADLIRRGEAEIVFHYAGGQHHARPSRTSGFCIFNDAALACFAFADRGWRVAYVDVDAHHGDGVQTAFYDTDRVLTISLHESGATLYPGTGFTHERGIGAGEGYAVNLPLLAGTDDEVYLEAFHTVVPPLVRAFQPDVLVTELGSDGHWRDRLTHLNLTTRAYVEIARTLRDLKLPWLALGGGGYNPLAATRCLTLMFGEMMRAEWHGREFEDELPFEFAASRGGDYLRDRDEPSISPELKTRAREYAKARLEELRSAIPLLRPGSA